MQVVFIAITDLYTRFFRFQYIDSDLVGLSNYVLADPTTCLQFQQLQIHCLQPQVHINYLANFGALSEEILICRMVFRAPKQGGKLRASMYGMIL